MFTRLIPDRGAGEGVTYKYHKHEEMAATDGLNPADSMCPPRFACLSIVCRLSSVCRVTAARYWDRIKRGEHWMELSGCPGCPCPVVRTVWGRAVMRLFCAFQGYLLS